MLIPGAGQVVTITVSISSTLIGLMIADSEANYQTSLKLGNYVAYLIGCLEHSPEGEVIEIVEYFKMTNDSTTNLGSYGGGLNQRINFYNKYDLSLPSVKYISSYISYYDYKTPFYGDVKLAKDLTNLNFIKWGTYCYEKESLFFR